MKEKSFLGNAGLLFNNGADRQYACSLKDLLLSKDEKSPGRTLVVKAAAVNLLETLITEREKKTLQSFNLSDIDARLAMTGKRTLIEYMGMSGYGGKVLLRGNVHLNKDISECLLSIKMDKLDLEDIKLNYPVYCELSGVISGNVEIKNKKDINVSGIVTAENFRLTKLGPLDKIADFIGITSIKEIANAQILADFDLSAATSVIKRFDLDSETMQVRSKFDINNQKWLEGEVALSLPRAMLEESKIFKTLISLARERNDLLDFVVHITGFLWQLRTELVKSDFRDKLKERISPGVQRYIETEANKAMDGQ